MPNVSHENKIHKLSNVFLRNIVDTFSAISSDIILVKKKGFKFRIFGETPQYYLKSI